MIGKGEHRHFMHKEIYEQPQVIGDTLNTMFNPVEPDFFPARIALLLGRDRAGDHHRLRHVLSMPAWWRNTGSNNWRAFRSRSISPRNSAIARPPMPKGGLALFISQSGETADTLAALRYCQEPGPAYRLAGQCAGIDHGARIRSGAADRRRAGNRRRLDQGLYHPVDRAGLSVAGPGPRPAAPSTMRSRRGSPRPWSKFRPASPKSGP